MGISKDKLMLNGDFVACETRKELEQEMDRYFETMEVLEHENIFESTFQKIAEYFYELGKKQNKLNAYDIAEIHALIQANQIKYNVTEGCYQDVADEYNRKRK